MEVKERFGLKERHSYDEIVAWLRSDPKGVPVPNRVATQIQGSHIYGQLKDSLRTFHEAQDAYAAHLHRGDEGGYAGPFVPPRPRFQAPDAPDVPIPPDDDDDDLMGPPGPGPDRYATLLEPGPNASDQVLLAEGMQPPPPPPPPAPSMFQGAGLGAAAGGLLGALAGQVAEEAAPWLIARAGAAAGFGAAGAAAGAAAGPAGAMAGAAMGAVGSLIGDAVAGFVSRGFEPGGGSSSQPSGPPVSYGPGGLQQRIQPNRQEAVNRQQRLHHQGTGAPAAQVDFRTLNGMNHAKPVDRKVRLGAQNGAGSTRLGIMGGMSGSSSEPMMISGSGTSRPGAPLDPGGTKISRNADPGPMQMPSYKDLVGKLKQQKAPEIGPVVPSNNPITPSRPRERSPRRGDRRPLTIQRGSEGSERDAALSTRSKTVPKPPHFDISTPRAGRGTKRKAEGPPSDEYQQDLRKAPPKPEGRLTSRNRIRPAPKPKPEPKPDQSRNRVRPAPKPKPEPKPKPDTSRNKTRNKKK